MKMPRIILMGLLVSAATAVVEEAAGQAHDEPVAPAMVAAMKHLTAERPTVGIHVVSDDVVGLPPVAARRVAEAFNRSSAPDRASFSRKRVDQLPPVIQCREVDRGADPCTWVGPGNHGGEIYYLMDSDLGRDDGTVSVRRILVSNEYGEIALEDWRVALRRDGRRWVVQRATLVGTSQPDVPDSPERA